MSLKKKLIFFFLFNFLTFALAGIIIISAVFIAYKKNADNKNSVEVLEDLSKIPNSVQKHIPTIKKYMAQYKIPEMYLPYILAQATQESSGTEPDIFQASESKYNGRMGMIKSAEESIEHAMKRWREIIDEIKKRDIEFSVELVLQTYNYGSGYLSWVKNHGNKYTKENAVSFSLHMLKILKGWAYNVYGDTKYIEHIYRYLSFKNKTPNSSLYSSDVKKLIDESNKCLGAPYVFGAQYHHAPYSFDCSSFVGYIYTKTGVKNMPRDTAWGIYKNYCLPISPSQAVPGDIVFFHSTYIGCTDPISHIGIYIGNDTMIHTGGEPGVCYEKFNTKYWQSHFYGFGRVKK
ncbi:lysozyme family protein [Parvimonas sp. S3374]|uniref:Lysozyme family protein n=1 Tax=Parvimonas parva TaxID=2769485 RepID=A0ABS1C956_9FIRM|nr:bifunctional lytic transglycosylase/C40 family peptidase [Parvimonas parva]MBK1468644.1 lysozyme family protein [Parvimonas parva]